MCDGTRKVATCDRPLSHPRVSRIPSRRRPHHGTWCTDLCAVTIVIDLLQPPRITPKTFQILLKTHKLVIVVSVDSSAPVSALKDAALSALTSHVLRQHEAAEAELRALGRAHSRDDAMDEDEDALELDGMGAGGELGLGLDAGGEMGLGMGTGVRVDHALADEERIPEVASTDEFELCRGIKEKGSGPTYGLGGAQPPPARFELLKEGQTVKTALVNWESVYLQFREESSGRQSLSIALATRLLKPLLGDRQTATGTHNTIPPTTRRPRRGPPRTDIQRYPSHTRPLAFRLDSVKTQGSTRVTRWHPLCACLRIPYIDRWSSNGMHGMAVVGYSYEWGFDLALSTSQCCFLRHALEHRSLLPGVRRKRQQCSSNTTTLFCEKVVCRARVSLMNTRSKALSANEIIQRRFTHGVKDVDLDPDFVQVLPQRRRRQRDAFPHTEQQNLCEPASCQTRPPFSPSMTRDAPGRGTTVSNTSNIARTSRAPSASHASTGGTSHR